MIKRFKATGALRIQPGKGHKPVTPVLVDAVKTAVTTQTRHQNLEAIVHVQFLGRLFLQHRPKSAQKHNAQLAIQDPPYPKAAL
ncbi:hypothetical protein HNY73_009003 [Argiope bruennichi]|uniref:Uncharacterized protein n=1 Tax=Argiope bruennichi TaxID=94029 RepID=A0A8T0FAH8_ARGBR|nr:hypothetical protein HNY73_009003 [Argiope bruennichi]